VRFAMEIRAEKRNKDFAADISPGARQHESSGRKIMVFFLRRKQAMNNATKFKMV
jgi:hypothetical protein